MKRRKENHPTSAPSAGTRKIIEFTTVPNPKEAIIHDRPVWDWGGIKQLLDQFQSLTTIRSIKSPNAEIERLAQHLYPLLPDAKGELKTLIRGAKRYHAMAQIGEPGQRAALAPYREPLRALAKAARQKLSVVLCRPNLRDWDLRAYRLFLEMQQNLGRFPRLHFVTITIRGAVNYHLFREQFKKRSGNSMIGGLAFCLSFRFTRRAGIPDDCTHMFLSGACGDEALGKRWQILRTSRNPWSRRRAPSVQSNGRLSQNGSP
jgi:hypothetical protein